MPKKTKKIVIDDEYVAPDVDVAPKKVKNAVGRVAGKVKKIEKAAVAKIAKSKQIYTLTGYQIAGGKLVTSSGNYKSGTGPRSAASKAASAIFRGMKNSGSGKTVVVHIRSNNGENVKTYKYSVTRKEQKPQINAKTGIAFRFVNNIKKLS